MNRVQPTASKSKRRGPMAVLRKAGLALIAVLVLLGFWQLFTQSPIWTISLIALAAIVLSLCFLAIGISEVTDYFWNRGHYNIACFLLKAMTVNLKTDIYALNKLGDLYFYGLGREKNWPKAAVYYGRTLYLDTVAKQSLMAAIGSVMADDAVIDWAPPACLPNIRIMAERGQAEAASLLQAWFEDDPFKKTN